LSEVWGIQEKARRVLQAATVEAYGRAGMYVIMEQLMSRANLSVPEDSTVSRGERMDNGS
jgi:hypothetical protein